MRVDYRMADGKGRVTLPGFENSPVILEQVTENEIRVRKARVIPVDELDPSQTGIPATSPEPEAKARGVIASIREFLEEASEESPISRDRLLEKLCQRFPERDARGMRNTIQTQLHNRLCREQGVNLRSSKAGYWIEK